MEDYVITLPIEIKHIKYNKYEREYFLYNDEDFIYSVSVRNIKKIPFFAPHNRPELELLEDFYKTEFNYWKNNITPSTTQEIERNLTDKYIIWKRERNNAMYTSIYGIMNYHIICISRFNKNFTQDEINKHLIEIYKNTKIED